MDVNYIEGNAPWLRSFGDHSRSSLKNTTELQTIARRHSFEPLYQPLIHSENDSKWNNSSVFFARSTIDSNSNEHHRTNDSAHPFCYLCSINQHTHERTEPREESKRRKLIPYKNPKARVPSASIDREIRDTSSSDLISYRFIVRTNSRKNSGTRAQVFLYMYGTEKNWMSIHLQGSHPSNSSTSTDGFPSGSIRTFCLKGPNIGQLHHLNVNLVGSRSDKEWFLKEIEITNLNTTVTWLCEFNCWLPKAHAQGATHVKPTIHRPVEFLLSVYVLQIRTGEKPFAGTDAKIQIKIHGSTGQTRRLTLTSQQANLFEQNQLDTFAIVGGDLGDLLEMIIESDRSHPGADWDVKEMMMWRIIPKTDHQRAYVYFPFNSWLGKKASLLKSKGEIYPSKHQEIRGPVCYEVFVKTGKAVNAGTDANVFLMIYGTNGRTIIHQLNNRLKNDFERNSTSEFTIMDIDVGQIERIKVWHDNSKPASAWFLDSILIHKKYSTSRNISNLYIQRVEQISQALYRLAHGQLKTTPSQSRTSKDSFDNTSVDRLGSSRSILRSPTMYDRNNLQKKVTWDECSIGSQDDLLSMDVQRPRKLQTKSEQTHRKEEILPPSTNYSDHQAYWISSHRYADKSWKIKSIEEVNAFDIDQRTRSLLLSDRVTTNNQLNKATAAIDDESYEFQANRWLAKEKEDGKLEIELIPKAIHKPTVSSVDSKKKPPPSDVQHRNNQEKENFKEIRASSPYDRKSMEHPAKDSVAQETRSSFSSRTHPSERNLPSFSRQNPILKQQQQSPRSNPSPDHVPLPSPLTQPLKSPRNINDFKSPFGGERELLSRITGERSQRTGNSALVSNQNLKPTRDTTPLSSERESLGRIPHRPPIDPRSTIVPSSSNQHLKLPRSTSERDMLSQISNQPSRLPTSSLLPSNANVKSPRGSNDLIAPLSHDRNPLSRVSREPPKSRQSTADHSKSSSLTSALNHEEKLLERLVGEPRTKLSRSPNDSVRSSFSKSIHDPIYSSTRTSMEPPTRSRIIASTNPEMSFKKSQNDQIYKSAYGTASPDDF